MSLIYLYGIIAGVIASCGLISKSMPLIIASMIMSPILYPFINHLLKIKDTQSALKKTLLLMLILFSCGLTIGFLNNKLNLYNNENEHMTNISVYDYKRKYSKLIVEFIVAICVGIGLPYAMINHNPILLVAFTIAPSITPPIVNSGLYISNYLNDHNFEQFKKSITSFLIGFMHIYVILICILIYSYYIMK